MNHGVGTSRRLFLASVGTGLGAPLLLGTTDKSGSKKPILGSGEHTYEAHHDWGALPANIQYGNTHGVCIDSHGHVYIHHTVGSTSEVPDSMVIFDKKGKFIKSWGKQFRGGAHGLLIRKEGSTEFLYLCDTQRGLVAKTTLSGEEVFSFGYPKEAEPYSRPGPNGSPIKYSPTNLAVSPAGDLYVADGYGSSYVNRYNAKGEYVSTFGGPGSELGKLSCPHGIILDERSGVPTLLIADRTNKRLQRFQLDGSHPEIVGSAPAPCHFDFRPNGEVVLPDLFARVSVLDKNNQTLAVLSDDSQSDYMKTRKLSRDHFVPGKFVCPHAACFDKDGNIYVVEWVEVGRVTFLRKV